MSVKRLRWPALLLVVGMVAAACGSGGSATTTTAGATTTSGGGTTTTGGTMAPPKTDVGVDLAKGEIHIGMLSDLTGPFGPLIVPINAGHKAFWDNVNANGGIHGLKVVLDVRDTQYKVDLQVQYYQELKDQVVAFGHSTGTPQTIAILPDLAADHILAIPLTWYSGWSDPAINANVVPHGAPYCLEAMDMIEYLKGVAEKAGVTSPKLALASEGSDYGRDSLAGAKTAAQTLGLNVVYDGEGKIVLTDETSFGVVADGIASSGADIVWITTTPTSFGSIYGQTLAKGFQAIWSGADPTWNPAFVAPDSAIKDAIARDYYVPFYLSSWADDNPGINQVKELMKAADPNVTPLDYYGEGFVEAEIMKAALDKAYDNGDLTQAGVLAAAKSLKSVDFNGLAPSESYSGDANSNVQRLIYIGRPDPAGLAAGTSSGITTIERNYVSDTAKNYNFTQACYQLAG